LPVYFVKIRLGFMLFGILLHPFAVVHIIFKADLPRDTVVTGGDEPAALAHHAMHSLAFRSLRALGAIWSLGIKAWMPSDVIPLIMTIHQEKRLPQTNGDVSLGSDSGDPFFNLFIAGRFQIFQRIFPPNLFPFVTRIRVIGHDIDLTQIL
jgi:hypothetical protein